MEEMIRQAAAGSMLLADYGDEVQVLLREDNWKPQGDFLLTEIRAGLALARGVSIVPLVVRVWGAFESYYGMLVNPHSALGEVLTKLARQERCTIRFWGDGYQPEHQIWANVGADLTLAVEAAVAFQPPPTQNAWWKGVETWRSQYQSFEEVWKGLDIRSEDE